MKLYLGTNVSLSSYLQRVWGVGGADVSRGDAKT